MNSPFPIEPGKFLIAWLVVTVVLVLVASNYGRTAVALAFGALLYAAIRTVGIKGEVSK